ncbi:MAG TPA: tetratricopeptide repeat protein [Thermoanaerobaculia bacterium]|nr:tetratricopeptide repeat protein [Thermoanaerobaculia bacterium]
MPLTINGFGTHYYGRRNRSEIHGTCEWCRRSRRLRFFDTTECICALYIPLVPLRRLRISRYCAWCRRHVRQPLAEFRAAADAELAPLRSAVDAGPRSAAARLRLAQGLARFQLYTEAEAAVWDGLAAIPGDAALELLGARLAALRGDAAAAVPLYEQALARQPSDPAALLELGRTLLAANQPARAAETLQKARWLDPGNVDVLYTLGRALIADRRPAEALGVLEPIPERAPEFAAEHHVVGLIGEVKRGLGMQQSDAERRAPRPRWPSAAAAGGGADRGASRRGWPIAAAGAGVLVTLLAALVAGAAWWQRNHVKVYFDNGLAGPVMVAVDPGRHGEQRFVVPPGPPLPRYLAPGSHEVRVQVNNRNGREIERAAVRIESEPFPDALILDRFFVYDVAMAHIYDREEDTYAAAARDRNHSDTYVALERFFEQRGVDYEFVESPDTLPLDHQKAVTKVAFNVAKLTAEELADEWLDEGKTAAAEKLLRRAIVLRPCGPARRKLIDLLDESKDDRSAEMLKEARAWVAACPEDQIEPRLALQDARFERGEGDAVLAESGARLRANPASAANQYLYARLLDEPAARLPYYRAALRIDPTLFRAQHALGITLLDLERCAEAQVALEAALRLRPEAGHAMDYAMAAVGAGTAAAAREKLGALAEKTDKVGFRNARQLLALAVGDFRAAEAMLGDAEEPGEPLDEARWSREVVLLRIKGDGKRLAQKIPAGLLNKELAAEAYYVQIEQALAAGTPRHVAEVVAQEAKARGGPASPLHQLYAAAALLLAGERAAATKALDKVAAQLNSSDPSRFDRALLAAVAHLKHRGSAAAVLAAMRRSDFRYLTDAYFFLGARAAADGATAQSRRLFAQSAKTAYDLQPPYLAAKALAGPG